jgi:hypothetical protein
MDRPAFLSAGGIVAVGLVAIMIVAGSFVAGMRYRGTFAPPDRQPEPPVPAITPVRQQAVTTAIPSPVPGKTRSTIKLFGRVTVSYDPAKFTIGTDSPEYNAADGSPLPLTSRVLFKPTGSDKTVLSVIDLNPLGTKAPSMDDLAMPEGSKSTSPLRTVVVEGTKYAFVRRTFGEGLPEDEAGTCMHGFSAFNDSLTVRKSVGVTVESGFEEKTCNAKRVSYTETPAADVIESALEIVESMKFTN